MLQSSRLVVFVLAGLAISVAGCSSNNKGKIEGKWKFVSGPGLDQQVKQLEVFKGYLYVEFKGDGTMSMGVESSDPNFQDALTKAGDKTSFSFKYRLKGGDAVEFYDMPAEMQKGGSGGLFGGKDKAKTNITINGDQMTMKDSDGTTATLTKLK